MMNVIKYLFIIAFIIFLFDGKAISKTLMITDSHGEASFGAEMVSLFEAQKEEIAVFAVGGSTPTDWLLGLNQVWGYWEYQTGGVSIRSTRPKTPKLEELLVKFNPERVLIELGTNLIWRDLMAQDAAHIQSLIALTINSGAKCFWIGPPALRRADLDQLKRVEEIHQMLQKEILGGQCQLIPSWEFTKYPDQGGDGIHYDSIPVTGSILARKWARDVARFIRL